MNENQRTWYEIKSKHELRAVIEYAIWGLEQCSCKDGVGGDCPFCVCIRAFENFKV